eukprot:scaffold301173_cov35-Attheya_sp.AAC.1
MRRKSDRHGADRHNGHKSQHRDSTESLNTSMQHRLIREAKGVRRIARWGAISGGVISGRE